MITKENNKIDYSETRFLLDHENKEKWTAREFATLTNKQKIRLVELVFFMHPEIRVALS